MSAPVSSVSTSSVPAVTSWRKVPAIVAPLPRVAAVVAWGLLVVACGKPTTSDESRPGVPESAGPPIVESTGPPAVEETGPERPAPTRNRQPSAFLPELPIGGDGSTEKKSVPNCVQVQWSGSQIPQGFSVVVTEIRIRPEHLFTLGKTGCPKPACEQSGTSFSFNSDGNSCQVTVIPQVYQSNGVSGAKMFMSGRAKCPTGKQAACDDFADKVEKQIQSINLQLPLKPPESPTPSINP